MEKLIVRHHLYPVLVHPDYFQNFTDQYTFRRTGSTIAALINLLTLLAKSLQNFQYLHLIALDFSKAFDTVRHSSLIQKCAGLPIDDSVHNWLIDYLDKREHCTKFGGRTSKMKQINASIVQGSGIGPVAYAITASDLQPKHKGNSLNKYADDSYLVVPSTNSLLVNSELNHIAQSHINITFKCI